VKQGEVHGEKTVLSSLPVVQLLEKATHESTLHVQEHAYLTHSTFAYGTDFSLDETA
jgi:hypothetical protein